jgi:hypothetical protein
MVVSGRGSGAEQLEIGYDVKRCTRMYTFQFVIPTQAQLGMNQGYHRFPGWNLLRKKSMK